MTIYLVSDTDQVTARCSNSIDAQRLMTHLPSLRMATRQEFWAAERRIVRGGQEYQPTPEEYFEWRTEGLLGL